MSPRLLDHFRPPLSESRHWESFHGLWACEIVRQLNRGGLPEDVLLDGGGVGSSEDHGGAGPVLDQPLQPDAGC